MSIDFTYPKNLNLDILFNLIELIIGEDKE